jgi:hypothetical protein
MSKGLAKIFFYNEQLLFQSRQGISAASETHGEFTLSHSQLESAHEATPDFDDCTNVNSLNVYAAAPAPLNATYVVSRDQVQ